MMRLHVLLLLTTWSFVWADESPATIEALFCNPENLEIVTSPERVEACILNVKTPWFSRNLYKRKYVEGKSKPVPSDAAQVLSRLLTDDQTYGWNYTKACMPAWNARVTFFRGDHYVSADFCFGCDILLLARDGQPFGGEDFDAASDPIFEIVRSLFPDDRVILDILKAKAAAVAFQAEMRRAIESEKANQPTGKTDAPDSPRPPSSTLN